MKLFPVTAASLCALAALVGCNNLWLDPMREQPKFKAYAESDLFPDHRAMRQPPDGTFPRETTFTDPALSGGDPDAGIFIDHIPLTVDRALLDRGQSRFNISCAPCHGELGNGQSIVASKMILRAPRDLLDDEVRALPDGKIEEVIRVGYGLMPAYETQLTARDRWAVVAYLRALQLSQRAPLAAAPESERRRLLTERAP